MPTYVAFLRAINVGGRRLSGDDLAASFEDIGVQNARSYLASGNVIFETDEAAKEISSRARAYFEQTYGWDVPTFVRSMDEVRELAELDLFAPTDAKTKNYVIFGESSLEDAQPRLDELSSDVDTFVARGREIHWRRDMDAGESLTTGEVEKTLGDELTRRTMRTLERLVNKFG